MNPLIGYGILSGVGSLASGLLNNLIGYNQSKGLMDYQYQLQQKAIDDQNLYNTPANQMKRLAEANLSPNLVYGSGVDGNQSSAASVSIANRRSEIGNPLQDFGQAYLQSKQLQMQEIANRNAAFESRSRRLNLEAKTLGVLLDNKLKDRTLNDTVRLQSQKLSNMIQEEKNLKAREYNTYADTRRIEAQTENIWKEASLIEAKTDLTWEQSLTEAVKRNLYNSQIHLNSVKEAEMNSYIRYLNAGTDLRKLGHDVQELEYEATKAYKEWKKKHPKAQLTLDMVKEGLGLGGQAAGIAGKFIP